MQNERTLGGHDTHLDALNKRLEGIGWGLLLILTGGVWLAPAGQIPEGAWLIGCGVVLLGLNAIRHFNGVRLNGVSTTLGVLALAAGLWDFFGVKLPFFPLFLILAGGSIIFRSLTQKNP